MTTYTVQAQTHQGVTTYNKTSDVETKHEMITDAIDTLLTTGGVIKCTSLETSVKYLVTAGNDYAVQDNEQEWIS